ncbi:hypothetical protein CAEBREN_20495 [Caenorhabditis brenneri]|uniref:G-protein coupled receptors family 1 profile domain-containing protein n=1 Tax=Caenorhabditis brenneri TaxID=135651 RepID=G0NEF6_CAEBE|nr:hypothetical protein CAEBREN_20495 [Caenorhabditis brenneri]
MNNSLNIPLIVVASSAMSLSMITFLLNFHLLLSIFLFKKVQRKLNMALIYSRFAVDMLYALANVLNLSYLIIRSVSPDIVIKNLSFFTAWPTFNLGSVRVLLVFLITLDRIFACCFPIFYRRHRSKIPNLIFVPLIFAYTLFEHHVLINLCNFVLDIPISCLAFSCSVSPCYRSYWLYFEQSTRISLLDACIIFTFDVLPSFLFANVPGINFQNVGPLTSVCKNSGFVIESFIICKVLIGKKPKVTISNSRISPNAS